MLAHFRVPRSAFALPALLAAVASPAVSQTAVTGTVRDERHAPLTGAAVQILGSRTGTVVTESGRYRLVLEPVVVDTVRDSVTVVARRVGFMPQSRRIAVRAGTITVDFVLAAAATTLSEVVVTGTGTTAERRPMLKDRRREVVSRKDAASADSYRPSPASPAVESAAAASGPRAAAHGSRRGRGHQDPPAGVLTAAVWDDAAHWPQYLRFLGRADENSWNPWGLELGQTQRRPVHANVKPRRSARRALDIGFLVDATGSMGDEMSFLQTELKDIVRRVRGTERDLDIRVSVVFYRDRGDAFITRSLPFTRDIDSAVSFIAGTQADGGGDFPEDMNAGLEAMMRQRWSRDAIPQMLFLVADAPPQHYRGADYTYHEAIQDAAANGIAIYPVAASGVDKPTEFLFRAMAVMTGGKYVFLTDDSGVGNPHEVPDITGYTVEKLNDLMVREIRSYATARLGQRVVDVR